jgi:hypothetical protein
VNSEIEAILRASSQAPSGENAQPWRFSFTDTSISIYLHRESDQSLYNFNNFGSLVACGAAIENAQIKAKSLGYECKVILFPNSTNPDHIADLILNKTSSKQDESLADVIQKRVTNRKPYESAPLSNVQVEELIKATQEFISLGVTCIRIIDKNEIKVLARVASTNEQIMLGNKQLHNFFFSHLTWSKEEDERIKRGFYIKTLELPLPIQYMFKLIRNWRVMQFLKLLNFPKLVGIGNADTYSKNSEMWLITLDKRTPENYVLAGRVFERLWLVATKLGLSLQPLTGTIFMGMSADADIRCENFSSEEKSILNEALNKLSRVARSDKDNVALMYRIGFSNPPSAQAKRFPVSELIYGHN